MTSLPAMVARPHQVTALMDVFTDRTEASIIMQLTTPGWRLPAEMASASLSALSPPKSQLHVLGVMTWL